VFCWLWISQLGTGRIAVEQHIESADRKHKIFINVCSPATNRITLVVTHSKEEISVASYNDLFCGIIAKQKQCQNDNNGCVHNSQMRLTDDVTRSVRRDRSMPVFMNDPTLI